MLERFVQTSARGLVASITWIWVLAAAPIPAWAAPSGGPVRAAEDAVRLLAVWDTTGAARVVRESLQRYPSDTLLYKIAGTVLLVTGDASGASSTFRAALQHEPDDALALYGLGLAALWSGDRAAAASLFERASERGDAGVSALAVRYTEALAGAAGAAGGMAVPDDLVAGARFLGGVAAARAGDMAAARADLEASLRALRGDPFSEPGGVLMTMDPRAPLRSGGVAPVPREGLRSRPLTAPTPAVSGVLTITPPVAPESTGFVVFRVGDELAGVVNTPPYRFAWDTSRVPNGSHRVEVLVFDGHGHEISRTVRNVVTRNGGAPPPVGRPPGREEHVRAALWSALALRPSRLAAAWQAAEASASTGDAQAARRYLWMAASIDPSYRDVRSRLGIGGAEAFPAVWRGPAHRRVVALTFDDGPRPGVTEALLAVLERERVPATFFVIGRHVAAHPDLTRRLGANGNQVENHSYTHRNLTAIPEAEAERELVRTSAAVEMATGRPARFFRPPGGNTSPAVSRIAARWGLTPAMWTVGADTYEQTTPDMLTEFVIGTVEAGSIVLLHNGRMLTVQALPRIIDGLRRRGFGFVTLDQLVAPDGAGAVSIR
ncbi:MAG TPA: polysaccharide deacetylase family protein [Chthonomonadales bacterium]|nr:polysaccharide deacetylase family protein [Chthonomonadales bacterium]